MPLRGEGEGEREAGTGEEEVLEEGGGGAIVGGEGSLFFRASSCSLRSLMRAVSEETSPPLNLSVSAAT